MNWLSVFVGVLIGWLAEWLIDLLYWRRRRQGQASGQAAQSQATGSEALGTGQESRRQRDSEILFQDCWRTLEERTSETERLKAQLAALQAERRNPPVAPPTSGPVPQAPLVMDAPSDPSTTALPVVETPSEAVAAQVEAIDAIQAEKAGPAVEAAALAAGTPAPADDLLIIEGVGPKIAALLKEHGITTFAQLGACDVTDLRRILELGGPRFQVANPGTWPQQARLAANGEWDALKTLQDRLSTGVER